MRLEPFETSTENGRSDERYRKVVLSAGGSVFHKLTTVLTSLISIPLTVNYLGSERFGLWMTITSVLSVMAFADFGIGNGLVNAIARAEGENDDVYVNKAISSSFYMLLILAVFFGLIFVALYPLINWGAFFNVKSNLAIHESGLSLAILSVFFLINLPLGIVQKIQLGYQLGYKNNLWLGFGSLLSLLGVVGAIYLRLGLPYLVGCMIAGGVVANVLNGLLLFKEKSYLLPRMEHINFSICKKLLGIGLVFFFLQLFTVIGGSLDNIIIAHILGASAVTSYAITKKMFMAVQLSQFVIAPLWPAFTEAMARKDYFWAKKTLIKTLKLSMGLGALTSLPLLVFGQHIITFWVNKDVVPSFILLLGFYLWTIFQNYGGSMSVFLNNDHLIKKQLKFVCLSSVVAIFLQVVLCANFGVVGIVYGLLIGYLSFYVMPSYKLAFKVLNNKVNS